MEDETKRQSLLDVVIEEYNLEKDLRTSRLMYIPYPFLLVGYFECQREDN
jgi:hypothetical protein